MKKIYFLILSILNLNLATAQEKGLIRNIKGHLETINALSFSPDGKYLASVGGNARGKSSELKVWDTETGKEVQIFDKSSDYLADVSFSPDGNYILTAGGLDKYNNLKIWDLKTGKVAKSFVGHEAVSAACFSPDGKYVISAGLDKSIKLWNIEDERVLHTFLGHKEFILDITFSPNAAFIASCGGDFSKQSGELMIWDMKSGKLMGQHTNHSQVVNSIAFSPDSKSLLSATENGILKLWDIQSGKEMKNLSEPYTQIKTVSFSSNAKFIAVSGKDRAVKIWDTGKNAKIMSFTGHLKPINAITFSPDGTVLASGGEDLVIKLWRVSSYKKMIESYVNEKMNLWQKKGKFEKSEDYELRINELNRRKQIDTFAQEAIENLFAKQINWKDAQNYYDADNESFRIVFRNFNPMYLKVPIAEAQSFDKNFNQLLLLNPAFTLAENDKFALLHLEFINPENGKNYSYNSEEQVVFNSNQLDLEFEPTDMEVQNTNTEENNVENQNKAWQGRGGVSEVDFNFPKTQMNKPNSIAVIIGNALYKKVKTVDFALNDSRSVRNYLIEVMGFKRENIIYLENASLTDFKLIFGEKGNHKGKLNNLVKPDVSEVFVFYSGHGAPGLNDKRAYLVPVECEPQYVELTGYSMDIFYDNLAKIPAKSMVVALDACFSGENIYKNISPIVIKSKGAMGLKNGALLASSSAEQVSTWYNEKRHGLFTYFFLKAIHNKNGDKNKDNQLSLEEIYQYISDSAEGIPYYARRLQGIEQSPVLIGQNLKKVLVEY